MLNLYSSVKKYSEYSKTSIGQGIIQIFSFHFLSAAYKIKYTQSPSDIFITGWYILNNILKYWYKWCGGQVVPRMMGGRRM